MRSEELSEVDFLALRNIVYDSCGVFLDNKLVFQNRLLRRMERLDIQGFRRYYLYLRYDGKKNDELSELLDLVLVNETYFYREVNQLRAFEHEIVPRLADPKRRVPIRIWSAGCSSGEEPYTLAMILMELGVYDRVKVEIYGTDLSRKALAMAREGVYSANSFRGDEMGPWMKYFVPEEDRWRVCDRLREKVIFRRHNLLDREAFNPLRGLSVIFCRNVMIYFDRPAKKRVVKMFHDRLGMGGYLFLGHAEGLTGISGGFQLERLRHDLVYRKIAEGKAP